LTLDQAISLALHDNRQVQNAQLASAKRKISWQQRERIAVPNLSSTRSPANNS
jgi:hypothetical protein